MLQSAKPVVLVILDGWGHRDSADDNGIKLANTPQWDRLMDQHPNTLIGASGAEVGLPAGQMGNSEVGHLNLGAGRVVYQEYTRISRSIRTGSFFTNKTLVNAVDQAAKTGKAIHILGLLSPGGVHSHEEHIQAMVKLAVERDVKNVNLHAFLDGRDTPPKSAEASLSAMEKVMADLGGGKIASVIGRYFSMDRDYRWQRVEQSYDLIAEGRGAYTAPTALGALEMAYGRGETDEFVSATAIHAKDEMPARVEDGDIMIFMNFRSDRARQLTKVFIEKDFDGFERKYVPNLASFVSLAEYNKEFYYVPVAFPPERLDKVFGEHLSSHGLTQLRIAETEKYAHVTFFFNGGVEHAFEGEDRILIQSPDVATYDLQPEMCAPELTTKLVAAIKSNKYDAIICNYANADMVGHTGNLPAVVKAIEALDACLAKVVNAVQEAGGAMLVTADHGNAEKMLDTDIAQAHTAHTTNPVPLVYVGEDQLSLRDDGALSDIAPTMLALMGVDIPAEMNGQVLVEEG